MVDYMFDHDGILFGVQTREGVMATYEEDDSRATTLYRLYIHDSHADVSDAVERDGVWVPLTTMHWKEIRDSLELDVRRPDDMSIERVGEYVENGAYERLVSVTAE